MKRFWKIAVCLAGGLALNAGLRAATPVPAKNPASAINRVSVNTVSANNSASANSANNASPDNPYAAIAARNIFGLNPPAPPGPVVNPEDNLPKITPEGIMGVFGNLQVLFKVAAAKPTPADKEEYYALREGQRQDGIEVVKIDDKKSLVTFNNNGITQELPLAEPGASGAAAPAKAGGMNPGITQGAPGASGNSGSGGLTHFGTEPGGNSSGMPNSSPSSNGGGPSGADSGMNFGSSVAPTQIYQPEPSVLTPEAATILTAGNHAQAIKDGDPTAQLFPPTVIDSQAGIPSNTDPGNNAPPSP
jgi:hypothetical protein